MSWLLKTILRFLSEVEMSKGIIGMAAGLIEMIKLWRMKWR